MVVESKEKSMKPSGKQSRELSVRVLAISDFTLNIKLDSVSATSPSKYYRNIYLGCFPRNEGCEGRQGLFERKIVFIFPSFYYLITNPLLTFNIFLCFPFVRVKNPKITNHNSLEELICGIL